MQRDVGRYGNFWNRLDVILTVMSYCKGATCRNPFLRVHPDGRCGQYLVPLSTICISIHHMRSCARSATAC